MVPVVATCAVCMGGRLTKLSSIFLSLKQLENVLGFVALFPRATMTKFILVSGGVVSGIGKGVIGAIQRLPSP